MADAITIKALQDASLDAKSLEQFVNGSEDETVLTRLSAEYPTLQKAIKELFENGGIAGRFKTLAELQASGLANGDYAIVSDDTGVRNGLYIKESGNWIKTKYSAVTERYFDSYVFNLLGFVDSGFEIVTGALVETQDGSGIFVNSPNHKYIKVDVSEAAAIKVAGAKEDVPAWKWVFVNKEMTQRVAVSNFYGNGVLAVPKDAYYAIRTHTVNTNAAVENDGIKIDVAFFDNSINTNSSRLDELEQSLPKFDDIEVEADVDVVDNYIVDADSASSNIIIKRDGTYNGKYIKVKVDSYKQLVVSNVNPDASASWKWVFTDKGMTTKLGVTNNHGDGVYQIPEGAYYAVRTIYINVSGTIHKDDDLSVKLSKPLPDINQLYYDINSINKKLLTDYVIPTVPPERIIAESGKQVYKLSSFEGADSDAKIRNGIVFIKKAGGGILDMEKGHHYINSAITLPSGLWLYLNHATLQLADRVFDNIIRNEGIVLNPDLYQLATALNKDSDIRIFGAGVGKAFIKGPANPKYDTRPHASNNESWVGDDYGFRTIGILLANTKNYAIHDFSVTNSTAWAISQEHGCENFEIYNINFDTHVKNGDGVDVRMGCKNGHIYNITGFTQDDTVACTAVHNIETEWPTYYTSGSKQGQVSNIYPMQVGGYQDKGFGIDIQDIKISNVRAGGSHQGIMLLASGGSKVGHISINGVGDTPYSSYLNPIVYIASDFGTGAKMGDIHDVTVNDVESFNSPTAVRLGNYLKDSHINDIKQHVTEGDIIINGAQTSNVEFTNNRFL